MSLADQRPIVGPFVISRIRTAGAQLTIAAAFGYISPAIHTMEAPMITATMDVAGSRSGSTTRQMPFAAGRLIPDIAAAR